MKILFLHKDREDSKISKETSTPLGEIDGKDDYNTLKNTVMKNFNSMIRALESKYLIYKNRLMTITDTKVEGAVGIHFFLIGDYKFTATVRGRIDRAQFYCDWCQLRDTDWKANQNDGLPITNEILEENFNKETRTAREKLGCVEQNLLPSIEPAETLIGLLHQLLGTGNDIRKSIMGIIEIEFEKYDQKNYLLYQRNLNAERQLQEKISELAERKEMMWHVLACIHALEVSFYAVPITDLCQIEYNNTMLNAQNNKKTYQDEIKIKEREVKSQHQVHNATKKKLKESLEKRKFQDRPV